MDKVVQKAIAKDKRWRADYIACGLLIVALTLFMGAFLLYQGSQTFLKAHHSVWEFLFTSDWAPLDKTGMFGGKSWGCHLHRWFPGNLLVGFVHLPAVRDRLSRFHDGNFTKNRRKVLPAGN